MSFFKNLLGGGSQEFTRVENDQRFNFMLQQMQGNRWKITLIILLTFFFIIFGIVLSVMFKAEIQESWKELQKKWGLEQETKKRNRALTAEVYKGSTAYRRETPHIPSLNSRDCCGVATKSEQKVYTGTSMLGIATMHKSNSVPVFSSEDAIAISKMRR